MVSDDTTVVSDRPEADDPAPHRPSVGARLFKVVAGLVVAASFAVWGYAYSGQADRPPPDLLADADLAARAEAICADAVADVEAMPSALDAVDAEDRADQILATTARFEAMVAELGRLEPTSEEDRVILDGFTGDWDTLLGNRRAYAQALTEDPAAPFLLSAIGGERLDRRMTRVADTNRMYACGAPTDVG
jgi:hypothetical protein